LDVLKPHVPSDAERDLFDLVVGKPQPAENFFRHGLPDHIVVIETDPVRRAHKRRRLANIVEQHRPRQHQARLRRQGVEHHPCVREHIAFGMVLRRLLHAFQRRHFRQDYRQQPGRVEQRQSGTGMRAREDLAQLIPDPFGADDLNLPGHRAHRRQCGRLDGKLQVTGKPDTPQQAQLVLCEPVPGIADAANQLALDVRAPVDEVEDLISQRIEK